MKIINLCLLGLFISSIINKDIEKEKEKKDEIEKELEKILKTDITDNTVENNPTNTLDMTEKYVPAEFISNLKSKYWFT